MDIKVQPMGDYQTNCYIITINDKDIIILILGAKKCQKSSGYSKYSWTF